MDYADSGVAYLAVCLLGYGDVTPTTNASRIATMIYAVIGVPIMLLWVSKIGALMATVFRFLYFRGHCPCSAPVSSRPSVKRKSSKYNKPSVGLQNTKRNNNNGKSPSPVGIIASPTPYHPHHHGNSFDGSMTKEGLLALTQVEYSMNGQTIETRVLDRGPSIGSRAGISRSGSSRSRKSLRELDPEAQQVLLECATYNMNHNTGTGRSDDAKSTELLTQLQGQVGLEPLQDQENDPSRGNGMIEPMRSPPPIPFLIIQPDTPGMTLPPDEVTVLPFLEEPLEDVVSLKSPTLKRSSGSVSSKGSFFSRGKKSSLKRTRSMTSESNNGDKDSSSKGIPPHPRPCVQPQPHGTPSRVPLLLETHFECGEDLLPPELQLSVPQPPSLKSSIGSGGSGGGDSPGPLPLTFESPIQQPTSIMEDEEAQMRAAQIPITLVICILVLYILLGAAVFEHLEKDDKNPDDTWSFLNSAYFCFITLSTIGLGDMTPDRSVKDVENKLPLIFCCFYLVIGLAVIAMSFNLVQEQITYKVKAFGRWIGVLKTD